MDSPTDQLKNLLARFIPDSNQLQSAVAAVSALQNTAGKTAHIPGANVDLDRKSRCGFPEVVYGEGKPAELVAEIFREQQKAGQHGFATRISPEQADVVLAEFPGARYNQTARTLSLRDNNVTADAVVAVVSAGSCDAPVAQEAVETLHWMQVPVTFIEDVGVAGPQRLIQHVPTLQKRNAVVCVAGMEAALPSVLGGYVSCPVIGVPTSVGYGASLGGITAMLSMLTCCASNVVTVNVDAGFRGGYVAGMIARQSLPTTEETQANG